MPGTASLTLVTSASTSSSVALAAKRFSASAAYSMSVVADPDLPPGADNNPALWDKILGPIRQVYGFDAVIAGGCIRDHLLGREPKDIDIFVNIESAEQLIERIPVLEDFGFTLAPYEPCGDDLRDYDEVKSGAVKGVLDGSFYDDKWEWHVQIIARGFEGFNGEQLASAFDLGITRCWYDGQLHDTPEARADRENFTVSILTNTTPERSVARAHRFIERTDFAFRKVPYVSNTL